MSDPVSPVQPFGSDATLACTVDLNNSSGIIDIPVVVNTEWTGPDGFSAEDSGLVQPAVGNTQQATYTSTAIVSSFRREQSGVYTCIVTVDSLSSSYYLNSSSFEAAAAMICM